MRCDDCDLTYKMCINSIIVGVSVYVFTIEFPIISYVLYVFEFHKRTASYVNCKTFGPTESYPHFFLGLMFKINFHANIEKKFKRKF